MRGNGRVRASFARFGAGPARRMRYADDARSQPQPPREGLNQMIMIVEHEVCMVGVVSH